MKIEKVNDHQIRCTLTREDLLSRELKISELAYGTDKAKDLFRDMMQQAACEFGFEAEDIPLMIEAIPLNAECIVLIVTKVEDPEELDTRFARFAPSVNEDGEYGKDGYPEITDEVMDLFERIHKSAAPREEAVIREAETPAQSASEKEEEVYRIFTFSFLGELTSLAHIFGPELVCENRLYKNEQKGQYLLVVNQRTLSAEAFGKVCNTISEYGVTTKAMQLGIAYMDEHYDCIIPDNALQRLAKI
ncbi:MAG: adaptor protein MecA [Lachnospiraceae bacterium]|nr:adaptor protein MecA [Lachnospiraceae bacterium]